MKTIYKKMVVLLIICTLISSVCLYNTSLAYDPEADDSIIVNVLYHEGTEGDILFLELDDGTIIGDHSYEINYLSDTDDSWFEDMIGFFSADDGNIGGSGGGYFTTVAWIIRDGVTSLQLVPVREVRTNWSKAQAGWDYLVSSYSSASQWRNTTCMFYQYKCHFYFASTKSSWNIEPSRTATSYAAVVAKSCNP